jgi:NIMA (never in mitosis gene a)-related kinase 10
MATLAPPFYTPNLLSLASKICTGDFDQTPLGDYSNRIGQIIVECLCIDPQHRPDICSVSKLCIEELMLYTDRSCSTIQTLEKRLRHQDHQRELDLIKQQSQPQLQFRQRCLSCSSAKE